jgi:hypothetical protein
MNTECLNECTSKTAFCDMEKYRIYYASCPCRECILKVNCSTRCKDRDNIWEYLKKKELQ